MATKERMQELGALQVEFDREATTDERRVEILLKVQVWAAEEQPESHCVICKKNGLYIPYDYALIEGHCYSEAGMQEYTRISKVCEYCFDKMHKDFDPDDDDIPEVGPRTRDEQGNALASLGCLIMLIPILIVLLFLLGAVANSMFS